MRILLTGGGTGGHIFPLFAVVKEIKKIEQSKNLVKPISFLFIGALDKSSKELFDLYGIPAKTIPSGKFRRYFSLMIFLDFFRICLGIIQSFWKVLLFMPDVIFSKGGYGSVPVAIVGWFYRIPIIIHDSDAKPGLANRFTSLFAKRVAVSFEEAKSYFKDYKVAVTGNPVREDMVSGNREKAKQHFGINSEKPVLLVLCGSQGAKKINDIIIDILPQLLEDLEIIHQTGEKNYEYVKEKAGSLRAELVGAYHPVPFIKEELKDVFAVADLVLSRSGSTINEIAFVGKPSILIPLSNSASNHQRENAYIFARAGASVVIEEQNLTPHLLLSKIKELLNDKELLKAMSEKARKIARPEAAKIIAKEVYKLGE